MLALIRPANAAVQLVLRSQAGRKEDATASLNLSASPTRVLTRLGNAAAQLPLRGQPRRAALRSQARRKAYRARSAETKGEGARGDASIPALLHTTPAPTRGKGQGKHPWDEGGASSTPTYRTVRKFVLRVC